MSEPVTPADSTAEPTETPDSTTTPETPPPPPPKKYKVKVDDSELEVDENELVSSYQLRRASQKRFEEASEARKQAEAILQFAMKHPNDPRLKEFGFDWDKTAEEYVVNKYSREKMTPEQRELEDFRTREKQRLEAEAKAKEESEKTVAQQRAEAKKQELLQEFVPALKKHKLPENTESIRRMAHFYRTYLKLDPDNKPPVDLLAQEVRESYVHEYRNTLGGLEGDDLLETLGDDLRKKIRKAEVARVRGGTPPGSLPPPPKPNGNPQLKGYDRWLSRLAEAEKS